jgi:hypothetical protein
MTSIYYSAAWTDSGFLLGCSHQHKTVTEATSCIPCAGGYVVAVENGVMRSLAPTKSVSSNTAVPAIVARTQQSKPQQPEFVLRFLSAYGLPQQSEPISHTKHAVINTELIDAVLSRLCELETSELRRMYAEDKSELVKALVSRVRTILVTKSRCK